MATIVEVGQASKTYADDGGDVHALIDVTLDVEAGEILAVTGASGSGKSTLLHLLAGLDTPTSGTVRVRGTDIGALSHKDRERWRENTIGYVFQTFNLVGHLSGIDNVALPLMLRGQHKSTATACARELIEELGLADVAVRKAALLSAGQRQRVAVARATIANPPLLLCDEPTGNLDSGAGYEVVKMIHTTARDHDTAVVVVTHDRDLSEMADRQIILRDGRILADTT